MFPLSGIFFKELFDTNPAFKQHVEFVIEAMDAFGVAFSSPGGSYGRMFNNWFNPQLWKEIWFMYPDFKVSDNRLEDIASTIIPALHINLQPITDGKLQLSDAVRLSDFGKYFISQYYKYHHPDIYVSFK